MPEKFKDKYRIPSNRLRGWDYASSGHYYITIVTADRKRWFGEIVNGEMVLNDWGRIVYDEFFKSFEMRAELFLGAFVLMPDHLHAIVILDKTKCVDVRTHDRASLRFPRWHHQRATLHPRHSNANPNPFRRSLPVSNRQRSNVSTIGLMRTVRQWRNSTKTIPCGNRITMTISSAMKWNTNALQIILPVIQWNREPL